MRKMGEWVNKWIIEKAQKCQMSFISIQFSCSIMSDSLWPHGLQHARFPCPSPSPRACSNSCHQVSDAIRPFHPLWSPSPPAFNLSQHQSLSSELALCIRWPKYWSFSMSPSNEYSRLISFRMHWLDLLAVSRVFSNTTVEKHQFFGSQLSLWSNSHIQMSLELW